MKTNDPGKPDEPLRKVLKEWRGDTPLPPGFQEQVWRRIERAETRPFASVWQSITRWVGTVLPRPTPAISYLAILLTIGVTAGWHEARQETARVTDELGQRYVRVLDPYQAPRR